MDLFKPTEKAFCNKIKPSSYEQSLENRVLSSDLYPSLIESLFSNFDHHYTLIDERDKELYVKQRILEIASDIDENSDIYNSFNYLKNMNRSDVQQGLQKNNTVSALLYLSDLYKVSTVVYLEPQYASGTFLYNEKKQLVKQVAWKPNRAFIFSGIPNVTWHDYGHWEPEPRVSTSYFIK